VDRLDILINNIEIGTAGPLRTRFRTEGASEKSEIRKCSQQRLVLFFTGSRR
jgi:hypothetical protein